MKLRATDGNQIGSWSAIPRIDAMRCGREAIAWLICITHEHVTPGSPQHQCRAQTGSTTANNNHIIHGSLPSYISSRTYVKALIVCGRTSFVGSFFPLRAKKEPTEG